MKFFRKLILIALATTLSHRGARSQSLEATHGTVNIVLASGSSLVVVTDSMLTRPDGSHPPDPGTKLYAVDPTTTVAIADAYQNASVDSGIDLSFDMPSIMADVAATLARQASQTKLLYEKADVIGVIFAHRLSISQSEKLDAEGSAKKVGLQLTIAGPDPDGSMKVAIITLAPEWHGKALEYVATSRPPSSQAPLCERAGNPAGLPGLFTSDLPSTTSLLYSPVGEFFCAFAGLSEVAEQLLSHPERDPSSAILQAYAEANRMGHAMTKDQLLELATYLVGQVAQDEEKKRTGYVGGKVQKAAFLQSKLVLRPDPPRTQQLYGASLASPLFSNAHFGCGPSRTPLPNIGGMTISGEIDSCTVKLDGMVFLNSTISDSNVQYDGGSLHFGPENTVINSKLSLGHDVDLSKPGTRDLICGLRRQWTSIDQAGKPLTSFCFSR